MGIDKDKQPPAAGGDLRQQGDDPLPYEQSSPASPLSHEESQRLIRELQVRLIELEMQNEELRRAWDERNKTETQLGKYSDLYDFAPVGYFNLDHDGIIHAVNFTGAKLLGSERSLLINGRLESYLSDETRQVFRDFLDNVFTSREKVTCKVVFLKDRQSPRTVQVEAVLSESMDECRAVVMDITAEAALLESENRLRYALEGTNDGLWDVQMKTGKTYLSPRSYEILDYNPDEGAKIAGTWADLVHPDDLPLTNERLKAHIEGRAPIFEVEQRLRMKSGVWKWVLARGKVVTWDTNGKPLRITGTHTDLTLQKKLESELHHSQKMESIGRLAGGVAHDFNNMLSVILGYACLGILESDPTQPLHSYLTEIHTAAERSAGLTQKLLTFARKQTITPEVLDLNDTVGGMFKVLQRLIGENIFLNWQPAANLHHVKVDPTQIDQILVNLCANARDAISDTGKITIETEKVSIDKDYCSHHAGIVPGEYVRLVVSDDGCGMDLEMLPHIFEPFFTTKGIAEGTGLGLATVYGAVKLNNGFIYVDSEPGSGTTFSIYLPQHAGGAEQAKESAAETAPGGQETIMLVDDEQAILDMTTMFLTRQGYTVLQTNSPAEAIRLAAEHEGEISLLISDVIMPEMNGKELATNLLVPYPHLKCLFMSGYTANVIAHHGMLDKGVNFIQKPFSLPALANKVREILDTTCRSILEE